MKRTLALLLSLLTVFCMMPAFAVSAEESPVEAVEAVEAAPIEASLPASFTLKGDMNMPPVDNQGTIGCCVSDSEAFLQFTNAVSRYLHSINPNISWNPSSGDLNVIFSPKWTYNFSGPGCEWVYTILKHHGAATLKDCMFYKSPTTNPFGSSIGSQAKSRAWDVTSGVMERALQYRLNNYDIIEFSTVTQMTDSYAGQKLLERIKTAIVNGNTVSVSGDAYNWAYYRTHLDGAGTLGRVGDNVVPYSSTTEGSGGGHCVSLVGYDDNITCTWNGVTLRGGFLMMNSWGTSFCDNGYVWIMYDALNTTSEYEALNDSGRCATFGQYCFTDWTKDITVGYPELMMTVDITVADRETFDIILTRTDAEGNTLSFMPQLFVYGNGNIHPFNDTYKKMNFAGVANGSAVTGTFTLSYEELAEMEAGKTIADYTWGFVVNADPGASVTVGNAVLKNASLQTIASINQSVSFSGSTYEGNSRAFGFGTGTKHLVVIPSGDHYATPRTAAYTTNLVDNRGSYGFTIVPDSGFTAEYARVFANGTEIFPNIMGEYVITNITTDTFVKIVSVLEDKDAQHAEITAYNNAGWEYYDGEYVFVVSAMNNVLDDDIYAKEGEVGGPNYPYYFRITIDGLSYYTQPVSVYRFDSSTLYRLKIVSAGYKAVEGTVLSNVLIEVVCEDHVIYTSTIPSTTVTYSRTPSTTYKVTYKVGGETVATDVFPVNSKLVARKLPERLGFTASWSPALPEGMPSQNLTVNGVYERYGYVVTWVVDGKSYSGVYAEGELPVFDGTPVKPNTKQNTYVFTGWSPAVTTVTGDVTYTAQFEETPVVYTVTWVVGNGTYTEEYTYGQMPAFNGDTSKPSDAFYDYTFAGWDKTLRAVTKDATYTAKYTQTERDHIPGDIDGDGYLSVRDISVLLAAIGGSAPDLIYDVNGDGSVGIQDVSALLSMLAN